MKIDKAILWQILEKYDSKEYEGLCNGLSRVIQGKSNSSDLLAIFVYLEKLQKEDRDVIEGQIGNNITGVLLCI